MPFIADQAAKAQTLRNRKLGQRQHRLPWEHSAAAHPRVHIDDHTERHLGAGRCRGERCDGPLIVDPTMMSVTRESCTKRSIAVAPAISLASRMPPIPLLASASASPSVAQVIPIAPAANCRRASATHLWFL
jgi:hypothetical protein